MLMKENFSKMFFTGLVNLPVLFWFFAADYLIVNRIFFTRLEETLVPVGIIKQ